MMMVEEYRSLTGAQKAAILMMALGEEPCARLFALMHEDEIKEIPVYALFSASFLD